MKTLIAYVNQYWGVAQTCTHCRAEPVAFCSGCLENVYCSVECQTTNWYAQHKYDCISGKDEETQKRQREEEEEDDEDMIPGDPKRIEISSTDLTDLSSDVWQRISSFLSAKDLKNLSVVSQEIQRQIRRAFFNRFRYKLGYKGYEKVSKRFKEIEPYITAVRIETIDQLRYFGKQVYDVYLFGRARAGFTLEVPDYITRLTFDKYVNPHWGFRSLPKGLTHLKLGVYFDQPVDNLPESLVYLRVGHYISPFEHLPKGLLYLNLTNAYSDYPVDNLPQSLIYLKLGPNYGLSLKNLPINLKTLKVSTRYPLSKIPSRKDLKIIIYNA